MRAEPARGIGARLWLWSGLPLALLLAGTCWGGCVGSVSKQNKKDAELHFDLGLDAFHKNDVPTALAELRQAEDLDPTNPRIPNALGLVYLGRDLLTEAQQHFEHALELDPTFTDALNNLGAVYLARGRWDKTIEVCRKAANDLLYAYPWLPLGNIGWAAFKKGDLDEALTNLKKAVDLNPKFCRGWDYLGQVHMARESIDAAELALRKAIERCPGFQFQEAHFHLAVVLQRLGQEAEAREQFVLCMKASPESDLGLRCRRMAGETEGRPAGSGAPHE